MKQLEGIETIDSHSLMRLTKEEEESFRRRKVLSGEWTEEESYYNL